MIHLDVGIEGTRYKSTDPSIETVCSFFSYSSDNSADTFDSGIVYGDGDSFFIEVITSFSDRNRTSFH